MKPHLTDEQKVVLRQLKRLLKPVTLDMDKDEALETLLRMPKQFHKKMTKLAQKLVDLEPKPEPKEKISEMRRF